MAGAFCVGSGFCCGAKLRDASHAGGWYPDDEGELRGQLAALLREAAFARGSGRPPKALIAPHAGLRYCGPTAACAYVNLEPGTVERIVVLGPSHHKRIQGCALPAAGLAAYRTPLGPLDLDLGALEELRDTGDFDELGLRDDEAEHSIEMQLPFVALAMEGAGDWVLLPILVGRLGPDAIARFAEHLGPLFDDPTTLFVVSSDFCHWGAKFRYQPRLPVRPLASSSAVPGAGAAGRANPINAGIESLDLRGIDLICQQDGQAFSQYLEAEGNTICGRNPIRLLLELLAARPGRFRVRFLHYSQSRLMGPAPAAGDSSVSYAAGLCEPVV
mmetsp:Transcript_61406/g.192477  ORF Transcript_61406/g.192477 Transcript_61406/m.192477 type:complete len:330 (-) Transcript_61406:44-1033(-)